MLYKTLKHKTKPNTFGQVELTEVFPTEKQSIGQLVHFESTRLTVKEVEVPILVTTDVTLETIKNQYSSFKATMGTKFDDLFADWEMANVKALINEL